jgi:hypothetical protein
MGMSSKGVRDFSQNLHLDEVRIDSSSFSLMADAMIKEPTADPRQNTKK